ncbi:MAG: hypothetical protein Q9223_002952 [Gallowayella weberi]
MSTTPAIKHPCFAHQSHLCEKSFTSFSGILSHLGSGNCRSGVTIDQINSLITYFPKCKAVINRNQEAWLQANSARTEVQQEDYDPRSLKWHCPHCDYVGSRSKKLAKHMRNRSCTLGALQMQRPDLPARMEKPFRCPRCNTSFRQISDVLGHAENGPCRPGKDNQALMDLILFLKAEIGKWGAQPVAESGMGVEDYQNAKVCDDEQVPPTEGEKLTRMRLPTDIPIEVSDAQLNGSAIPNTSTHPEGIKKWPEPSTSGDQQIMDAKHYPTESTERETTLRPARKESADYYVRSVSETLRILARRGEGTPPPLMRVLKTRIPEGDESRPTNVINELKSMEKLLLKNEQQSTSSADQLASGAVYPSAKPMQEIISTGIEQGCTPTVIRKEIVKQNAWSLPPAPLVHGGKNTDTTGPLHLVGDGDETDDSAAQSFHSAQSDDLSRSGSSPSSSSSTRLNRFDRDHHITARQIPSRKSSRLVGDAEDEHVSTDDDDEEEGGGVAL